VLVWAMHFMRAEDLSGPKMPKDMDKNELVFLL
jgi:hypothetical protein